MMYPLILKTLANSKKQNLEVYRPNDEDLPSVSILLAVYNEDKVIEHKIRSTFETGYPIEKIEFLIGSDASSDTTVAIIEKYQKEFPQLKLKKFISRIGKSGIINALAKQASNPVLILTDANVFFRRTTIYQLVKHYKNPSIALVGGNIINKGLKKDGVSVQEKVYLSIEKITKNSEGIIWGAMMGVFGGVYSIRKDFYAPVPQKFIVDDFYITLNVLENGGKTINEEKALAHEDVSNILSEEFRRKIRISTGNFQNLNRYKKMLLNPFKGVGFAFWSHKVLRWFGPFFLLTPFVLSMVLFKEIELYKWTLLAQLITFAIPIVDGLLKKLNIHFSGFRFITHFYVMNIALLVGFFKFVVGVKSNVWEPTKRYQ